MTYSLAIHGGVGEISKNPAWSDEERIESLRIVMKEGKRILSGGGTALETVEHCVCMLEDDLRFNAGCGSVPNAKGEFEMDASIMDGSTLDTGSVTIVTGVRNPVKLASLIIRETPHVMLAGPHALEFAKKSGLKIEDEQYFIAAREERARRSDNQDSDEGDEKHGTVGAVAYDTHANLAAATSTGGITDKLPGRVSDTSIIGAGNLADNRSCAVSCSGVGEHFIKTRLAERIACLIEIENMNATEAAAKAINYLVERINGDGGFLLIDKNGEVAIAQSGEMFNIGWLEHGGKTNVAMQSAIQVKCK